MDYNKSLEQLENDYWVTSGYSSYLVTTCHSLRKQPLKDFQVEDLRIMIGQNIGLNYLIPLAIERLTTNILAEGDYYSGDLLNSVLVSDVNYWKNNYDIWCKINALLESNEKILSESSIENLLSKREKFRNIFS